MPRDAALTDQIGAELRQIRQHVPGVRGSVAATSDGILRSSAKLRPQITDDGHDPRPG